MSTAPDHEPHPAPFRGVEALSTLFSGDLSHLCGASAQGAQGNPIGPCILRQGHDGPVHQDSDGVKWTGPESLAGRERDLLERAESAEARVAELAADCDELIAKNRKVIQQGAEALADAHALLDDAVARLRHIRALASQLDYVRSSDLLAILDQPKETNR